MKSSKNSISVILEPCHLIKSKFSTDFDNFNYIQPRKSQDLHFIDTGPLPCYDDVSIHNPESKSNETENEVPFWKRCIGLLCGLCASIFFSLSIVVAKYLNKYHSFNLGIWRSQGVLIPSIILLLYNIHVKKLHLLEPIWPLTDSKKRRTTYLLIIRSIFGCVAVLGQYYSLKFISVGDSSVISMSTPIFVTILAFFYLGEELGIVSIFAAVATLVGVVVVSRPPMLTGGEGFNTETLIGIGLALSAMSFTTIVFILLRVINDIHYSLVGIFLGGLSSLICLILAIIFDVEQLPIGWFDWVMAIALAATSFGGQLMLTLAFVYEQAGPISLIRTTDIIFAFIWQCIFFQENPDMYSIIGAIIIIQAVFMIGGKKWLSTLPETHVLRRKLWCLLK